MPLLTVRLSDSDDKVVRALRADGVPIADFVRTALRTEHERRHRRPLKPREVRSLIAKIEAAHPVPAGTVLPKVDTLDRKAVREFIVSKIKRRGRN
jgi:hypothetical protein